MEIMAQAMKQEGTQMYVGVMRVDDILRIGRVDEWRQEEGVEEGYQRAPETGRTGKVARYLRSDPKPLMPTSVLLSYRGELDVVSDENGSVKVNIPDDRTFWIVDGQHRLYGFKRAINEMGLERLRDYPLPIVIVENPSIEDEANQFRVINETMKKVRTDLARRILALRVAGLGAAARQEIRLAGRLWEAVAVEVLRILNEEGDSPWFDRIQPPNIKKRSSHIIRELSFSTSLKPILNEKPYRTWPADRLAATLKEYWGAWKSLVPEAFDNAGDYVLLKTPGAFSLHQLAYYVMEVLRNSGITSPTKDDFRNILRDLGEYAGEQFWRADNVDGAAIAGSMKGFSILADTMEEELISAGHTVD